jgi:RNA polymerase sigma factor (sigma-70 family)
MMKGKNDDAASAREDSFLAELIPQIAEHLAEQHADDFDAEAGEMRFLTWLAAHTKEPATPAQNRVGTGGARRVAGGWAGTVPRNGPQVAVLVSRAAEGDEQAWDALVERYAPLIWSICRKYGLNRADAEDVGQQVWLRLVDQLGSLRNPAALPGWVATTTRRECDRVLTARGSKRPDTKLADSSQPADDMATDEEILAAERTTALRAALAELPRGCQELIALLIQDPPVPYAEISARLGIPVSSIGPRRRRCLDKIQRHPAIAALVDTEAGGSGRHGSIEAG